MLGTKIANKGHITTVMSIAFVAKLGHILSYDLMKYLTYDNTANAERNKHGNFRAA